VIAAPATPDAMAMAASGIILACAVTLLAAPRVASSGVPSAGAGDATRGGWLGDVALAALLAGTLAAAGGAAAFALVAATALVLAAGALRVSRAAAVALALSAVATGGAAVAVAAGAPRAAFAASVLALALRTGIFPLHGGVAALTDRALALQVRQMATLPVLVLVHVRFAADAAWAAELAPLLAGLGAASTVAFALVALVQRTLRGLLHASVLMHGGMLFAAVGAAGRGHHAAALVVAITLGLAVGGLAIMLASLEARVGPLAALTPGGRARAFPRLAAAVAVFGGAAVGLPGTSGFVADDLLLHALWQESAASAVVTVLASALLAVATLAGFARAFLGRPVRQLAPDLLGGERLVVVALLAWLVVLGVAPAVLLDPLAALLPHR
jgi:NADH-quinone oxidoreductase subunit M